MTLEELFLSDEDSYTLSHHGAGVKKRLFYSAGEWHVTEQTYGKKTKVICKTKDLQKAIEALTT